MSRAVRRAPGCLAREIEGEVVLVSLARRQTCALNAVGAVVWACADGRDEDAIAATIASEFDVSESQAALDVRAFVDALEAEGWLVVATTS